MTYRRFILGHHLDSRYQRELRESTPRTAELNAQALRKAEQRLQDYLRDRPVRVESDIAWTSDNWMA